ncbi:SsrA-binding protein SmpB [Candidatus Falkowbacteria bacterium]|nr:SsrA-binding protein SmpB [Candidatus Falkowbacteria bacterium]
MTALALNKKAGFDYEFLEKFEAGIVLTGQEVKSIRQGQASLAGSFVTLNRNGEAFLTNAQIPPYKFAGQLPNYDPKQSRKLLLRQKELNYLIGKLQQSGLTLVPLSLYNKNNKIKLEFALARGKKKADKRQTIKSRETKRDIAQALKQKFRG